MNNWLALFTNSATLWLDLLIDVSMKATALILLAAVIAQLLRYRGAAERHMLWFTTLTLLLALPVFSAALPGWAIAPDWLPLPRPLAKSAEPAWETKVDVKATVESYPALDPQHLRHETEARQPLAEASSAAPIHHDSRLTASKLQARESQRDPSALSWAVSKSSFIVIGWSAGFFICVLRLLVSAVYLRRMGESLWNGGAMMRLGRALCSTSLSTLPWYQNKSNPKHSWRFFQHWNRSSKPES